MEVTKLLLSERKRLSKSVVLDLCMNVKPYFDNQPNILNLEVVDEKGIVVVGDLHGHDDDLVHILKSTEEQKTYLFLGDYIDRGLESLRVIMLIFSLVLEKDVNVYCLRGNHETITIAKTYGFEEECKNVYGEDGQEVFETILDVCRRMPIAAMISSPQQEPSQKKIFCCHAGLGKSFQKLEDIMEIDRKKPDLVDNQEMLEKYYSVAPNGHPLVDLLWSDPGEETKGFNESPRGCGWIWGEDISKKFCEENSVQLIIRSHQLVEDGFKYTHDKSCLTIFSASNYSYKCGNNGSFVIIPPSFEEIQIKQHLVTLSMVGYEKALCMKNNKMEDMGNLERIIKKKQVQKMNFLAQIRQRKKN